MTTSTVLRRGSTGKAGNKGLFDGHIRTGDELTLDGLTDKAFQKQFTAEFVPAGIDTSSTFDVDSAEVEMDFAVYAEGTSYFATSGEDSVEVFVYEGRLSSPQASLAAALREVQMEHLRALKKRLPAEQHAAVDAEIAAVTARQPLIAADWFPEETITLASDAVDQRFAYGDKLFSPPEGVENMFVSDKKVFYDTHLHSGFLAEIVVGEDEPDEENEEQTARFRGLADAVLTKENVEKVQDHIKKTYGLIFDDSDEWGTPLMIRAEVPTKKGGRPATLEWANEQVANGFERFKQDVDNEVLQETIADILGYERDQDDINHFIPKQAPTL
ncbi:hypothetical protein [Curtobacterium sp. MCSS17_016]|uniref:hypothetical protein n=1 Tax=Curtobacterium sp. MCSS17_016 TaxID=2175644 RepID=UPI0011B4B161|nr:hypothetical protein [Curtobacterium sp. MCSS17_016]WIE81502.1 hypothetical protein DEJ19_019895 [Curtobacterium sp. MCSS17_016]